MRRGLATLLLAGVAAGEEPKQDVPAVSSAFPVKFSASLTVRQDFTAIGDQNDLLIGDDRIDGLRARIRFGFDSNKPDSIVGGGLRFSTGETPNPTSPFIRLGDALRPSGFDIDRYFLTVRPLKDRERLVLSAGKMPLPLYRVGAGTWRDELTWDDDVSPSGLALQARLYRGGSAERPMRVDNSAVYFVFEDVTSSRFAGLTGTSYVAGDQVKLTLAHLDLALGYFHYGNLNVGLRAPSFTPGQGAFLAEGTSALLRRPGLQRTNNGVNYGPGAEGFASEDFDVWSAAGQVHFRVLGERLGKPELFLAGAYTRNTAVERDRQGFGATLVLAGGGWSGGPHPYTLHATYRDVDADGTLATFADSDLGAGTSCRGFEVGANYRVARNLMALTQFFVFDGFPRKDDRVRRLFFDLVWDF